MVYRSCTRKKSIQLLKPIKIIIVQATHGKYLRLHKAPNHSSSASERRSKRVDIVWSIILNDLLTRINKILL